MNVLSWGNYALRSICAVAIVIITFSVGICWANFDLPEEVQKSVVILVTFDNEQLTYTPSSGVIASIEQLPYYAFLIKDILMPEGKGKIYEGKIVKVNQPVLIYRVYTKKVPAGGKRNNRSGNWWTFNPPAKGITQKQYQQYYEICTNFNPDLDYVVQCRVYPGTILVIGPGQSEKSCSDPGERYDKDVKKEHLQVYVDQMFNHQFQSSSERDVPKNADQHIGCPPEDQDKKFEFYAKDSRIHYVLRPR
jgi:hypothetical protein